MVSVNSGLPIYIGVRIELTLSLSHVCLKYVLYPFYVTGNERPRTDISSERRTSGLDAIENINWSIRHYRISLKAVHNV